MEYHCGEPYSEIEEFGFRRAVWEKLQSFLADRGLSLTEMEFYKSLMISIDPSSHFS